nr:hypothetical protein [Gloeobacter violaceus]
MKGNQNRQDFAEAESAWPSPVSQAIVEQLLLPERLEALAEVIDMAKERF